MKVRDLLLCCMIGVLIAAAAILGGIYQARHAPSNGLPVKWLGFVIMTAFVFGNAIWYSKPFWRQPKFWGLLAIFSVFHFGLGFAILLRLGKVGLIAFFLATLVEYYILDIYLGWFLTPKE
jgi:hypothetical protein